MAMALAVPQMPKVSSVVVGASSVDKLALVLRPLGSATHQMVAHAVLAAGPSAGLLQRLPGPVAAKDCEVVDALLGPDSVLAMHQSPLARARMLGIPRQTLARRYIIYAAAAWYASRCLAGSVLSRYLNLPPRLMKVVGVFTMRSYDETPLSLRAKTFQSHEFGRKHNKSRAGIAKVLQSDLEVVIVSKCLSTGSFSIAYLPLPCPLRVIQRGTASCLKHGLQATAEVPHLDALRNSSRDIFSADFSCADRASANMACEDNIYSELPDHIKKHKMPCFAHCSHTCQGRSLQSCAPDVNGVIATSFFLKPEDSWQGFRACVRTELLLALAGVSDAPPLPAFHPQRQQLESLLRLCLQRVGEERQLRPDCRSC